jgi:hypothetical protein
VYDKETNKQIQYFQITLRSKSFLILPFSYGGNVRFKTRANASKFISFSGLLHYVRNDVHSKALSSLRGQQPEAIQKKNEKLKTKNEKRKMISEKYFSFFILHSSFLINSLMVF